MMSHQPRLRIYRYTTAPTSDSVPGSPHTRGTHMGLVLGLGCSPATYRNGRSSGILLLGDDGDGGAEVMMVGGLAQRKAAV